jgi:16S rRNA (guanine527-N7)-methyltransferase
MINVPRGTTLIDVGTGAGFPSIPLKICRHDIEITLLDSLNKRVNFLKEVSDELGLDARCVHGRAEETARYIKGGSEFRESFDIATARAVANLRDLCEYCLPFVKIGGRFVALKGKDGAAELDGAKEAIKILGGETELSKSYELPNGDSRQLIVIKKVRATAAKYPRNAGQIKKNPLR